MAKLRVHNFAISLDGYGTGPGQALEHGLGVGGEALFAGIDLPALGYRMKEHVATGRASHFVIVRGELVG